MIRDVSPNRGPRYVYHFRAEHVSDRGVPFDQRVGLGMTDPALTRAAGQNDPSRVFLTRDRPATDSFYRIS